jgi:hypothetical protein
MNLLIQLAKKWYMCIERNGGEQFASNVADCQHAGRAPNDEWQDCQFEDGHEERGRLRGVAL